MYLTNGFSVILLSILFIHSLGKKKHYTSSGRFFILLLLSTIGVVIFEVLSWRFDGIDGPRSRLINILFNYVFFLFNTIVPVTWLIYIDFKIHSSIKRLKKRLFYSVYVIAALIGLTINLFIPWIYTIDQSNNYNRLPGVYIYTIYVFFIIYSSFIFFKKKKTPLNCNLKKALLYFTLLPLGGAIAQILIPGSLIVWNAVALGTMGTFTSLELFCVSRDFLTGLLNRREFYDLLEFKISNSKKRGESFGLIMMDMDDFKAINDNFGHVEGDDALKIFANILRSSCKSIDHIIRFAGDEFIIILEDSGDYTIEQVIKRVNFKLDHFNGKGIKKYKISCSSAGIKFDPKKHTSSKRMLHDADMKMYKIKGEKKRDKNSLLLK